MPPIPALEPWQWAAAYIAAFFVGLAKTGITGVGIISIGLFLLALPSREAIGNTLLVLISADVLAIATYRRDADWTHLRRLFPWTALGVFVGFLTMRQLDDHLLARLIGAILLLLAAFQAVQRFRARRNPDAPDESPPLSPFVSSVTGAVAGFTTMAANAAGPVMSLYLLAMRLPKVAFVGTAAWFFFLVNLFKVPFSIGLGSITIHGLWLTLALFPGTLAGAAAGRWLLPRLNQAVFEWLALLFAVAAGVKLML